MAYYENHQTQRKTLDFKDLGLKDLVYLGNYQYTETGKALGPHFHGGTMEICYLAKGYQSYTVSDEEYHLKGGDVFITFPDEQHGTGKYVEEKGTLYWFQIFLKGSDDEFLCFRGEEARQLKSKILNLPHRHFTVDAGIKSIFDRLFEVGRKFDSHLAAVEVYALTTQLLLLLIESSSKCAVAIISSEIQKILDYIQKNIGGELSNEELASVVHLSVSHFKAKFKAEVGTSPADFVQRQKIEHGAKLILAGKKNITDIAFDLGYSSSQHFSSVFKKYTGKTPSTFKKAD